MEGRNEEGRGEEGKGEEGRGEESRQLGCSRMLVKPL